LRTGLFGDAQGRRGADRLEGNAVGTVTVADEEYANRKIAKAAKRDAVKAQWRQTRARPSLLQMCRSTDPVKSRRRRDRVASGSLA